MTPQEREARWEALKLPIGHCGVVMGMTTFHSSLRYWQSGEVDWTKEWSVVEPGDLLAPLTYTEKATVLIHGDCQADLSLADGVLVHIQGDLAARLSVAGHCEIVIGGNIMPGAGIEAEGISSIFVGGDLEGSICSTGSLKVSVHGNVRGKISTGVPITEVRVRGDFTGQMQPTGKVSLVCLEVQRFMPFSTLESIAQHGYTLFDATVAVI